MEFVNGQRSIVTIQYDDKVAIVNEDGKRDYSVPLYSVFVLRQCVESNIFTRSQYHNLSHDEKMALVDAQVIEDKNRHKSPDVELVPYSSVIGSGHICEIPPLHVREGYILHVLGFGLVRVTVNPRYPHHLTHDHKWTIQPA